MSTAVLVDGDFFLRRYAKSYGRYGSDGHSAEKVSKDLFTMALHHLDERKNEKRKDLYRIFFYDCPPLQKKAHNPVTNQAVDFSKRASSEFRLELHRALVRQRKLALRLGYLSDAGGGWIIRPEPTKRLLSGKLAIDQLTDNDVRYDVRQKSVDMKIGLDIATLALKQQVDQIVLVAGDSDFVPAAKLARREGIDFILDPMWHRVRDDLREHVDGVRSCCPRPS